MNLTKAIATIGGWTVLSRITGLMREMLVARYLGAGTVADAFFVAFRFPNMFRALFAEGAFNAAFVPLFSGKLEGEGAAAARRFAEQCFAVLAAALLGFVIVIEIGMPWAIHILASGFDDTPGKIALAVELSRITFPYLLFISMVSLQSGVLNAMGRFAAAAGTPVLLNLTSMAVLVALVPYVETAGHAMAWGVFASGIVQFLWLVFSVRRVGMGIRLVKPSLSPEVRLMLKRVVPGAVGAGVYQVNLLINTMIASQVADGAVSYLNYADRVNQLPLGVVGIAIGTALLPLLSRQLRAGETAAALESQNRAMEVGMLLTLPAATAFLVIAAPIIAVLFERGSFTPADTRAVAPALMAFALGLPAYVLVKVLTPGFFARHDTRTPVKMALATLLINVGLNLALMGPLAHVGMALSTAVAAWLNVALLAWTLKRRGYFAVDRRLLDRLWRIVAACLVMAAVLAAGRWLLDSMLAARGLRLPALCLLVAAGGLSFAVAAVLTGAARLGEFKTMLRRRR
ncbi:murein biosynthesis integral membrane protein MurJ [Telmatospirillum siberiense]|uniref:Probable lipid II flippase MurJ n=1 Tax=Telmatospirillum siberiense TaxID=382514 RepID=A0A2N3PSC4_9PROT|nr:murein biosynthesis integral membrane protein MurJ [Telmatospirillum siberiense]PKU23311.1 murein biosynthesis integral membrane protein MurJ [Telmatospirillum siberiense]